MNHKINNKIDLRELIRNRYPGFLGHTKIFEKIGMKFLARLLHIHDINKFLEQNIDTTGIHFIDEVFDMLNFSYRVSNKDSKKIPSEGRLIIVANHPVGSLDSLALISAVYQIRQDVKIVANDILSLIKNLDGLLLPYNLENKTMQRKNLKAIDESLRKEEAVIMFPAGEVSRLRFYRILDSRWNKGAVYFARKFNAPISPVYIQAKNSFLFYLASAINKKLSRLLLVNELFNKQNKIINLKIGDLIPSKAFTHTYLNASTQTRLLRKHVYRIPTKRTPIYKTEKNIIHPVDLRQLLKEIRTAKTIGIMKDGKRIVITDYDSSQNVLREIARLREITFRSVGEGSGKKLDLDFFDMYYKHIVVWDHDELEIVGSYRIGIGSEILNMTGINGFYTSTLFNFSKTFVESYLKDSIELGRSFVQKKYWNTNALNYLWLGIGAYIASNPQIKYMLGPVSISNSYPEQAKKLIVFYYNKWFGTVNNIAAAKNKFAIPKKDYYEFQKIFICENQRQDYIVLKRMLTSLGCTVPILLKHYTELCDNSGVKFLDFGVDGDFENCIDGLIFVEVDKIKQEKKERYIHCHTSLLSESHMKV